MSGTSFQHALRSQQGRALAAFLPYALHDPPSYWACRRFLRRAQWWSREKIERWQTEQLRRVVTLAYRSTEGYRELYRTAGIAPRDVRSLHDLRHLPIVTKEMLQSDLDAFSVPRHRRRYLTTGGSTGIPFGFYVTPHDLATERAFIHESWSWAGWHRRSRSAVLRGAFVGSRTQLWQWDRFRRQLFLSTYHLLPDTIGPLVRAICERDATVLEAYPSACSVLCDLLAERGMLGGVRFAQILLGSENVYDWVIAKLERTFPEARIHAWYGHAEQAVLASWCESTRRYHVWPFYGLAEVTTSAGDGVRPGDEGEILATSLRLGATPFIRYRTMDRAVLGPSGCERCGRQFQLLARVVGRAHEVIVTGTGRYLSMTMINFHDDIFDSLRQFQFVQECAGQLTFRFVPKHALADADLATLRTRIQAKLGDDVALALEQAETIPRTASGKYRFLDQRLRVRYGDHDD